MGHFQGGCRRVQKARHQRMLACGAALGQLCRTTRMRACRHPGSLEMVSVLGLTASRDDVSILKATTLECQRHVALRRASLAAADTVQLTTAVGDEANTNVSA